MGSTRFRPSSGAVAAACLLWATAPADGTEPQQPLARLRGHTGPVASLAFAADGKQLLSAGQDGTIRVWSVQEGKALRTLRGQDRVTWAGFSPAGRLLAGVGHTDDIGAVAVWGPDDDKPLRRFGRDSRNSQFYSAAFSPDGKLLATGNRAGPVTLWDPATGQALHHLNAGSGEAFALAFSPDGRFLAVDRRGGSKPLDRRQLSFRFSDN